MFNSVDPNETVASNEDETIELMMLRQNGSQYRAAATLESGGQGPVERQPDELGPAERGEVRTTAAALSEY